MFTAITYGDLLTQLIAALQHITDDFHEVFGSNIFRDIEIPK